MNRTSFYNRLEQSGLTDTNPVVFAQALQKTFWKITKVIFVDGRHQSEGDTFMTVRDPYKDLDLLNLPSYMVPGSSYTIRTPFLSGGANYTALLCVSGWDQPEPLEVTAQGPMITIKLTNTDFDWDADSGFAYLLIAMTGDNNGEEGE